jgi:quercetin 2,3-dioxygenase
MRVSDAICAAGIITTMKQVRRVMPKVSPHWVGNGFHVYPLFDEYAFTNEISPFLMFDYGAPKKFDPTTKRLGVGQHPHRGIETVTIAMHGEVEHGDSVGNHGVIGAGEVQWMTAGRGIIHEEYHSTKFASTGGLFEMCQIWVNLPAEHKMTAPRYQAITNSDIPEVNLDGGAGSVRIISGEFNGVKGKAMTFSPVNLWQVTLTPNQTVDLTTVEGHNSIVFCRTGSVRAGTSDESLKPAQIALLSREGDSIRLRSAEDGASILILDGQPLNEPIAAHGPFVMNTQAEIRQAFLDFQNGKMGK